MSRPLLTAGAALCAAWLSGCGADLARVGRAPSEGSSTIQELRPSPVRARFFPETGLWVSGKFLDYWEQNGGLAMFGYPLVPERIEPGESGWFGAVQWFERARFEDHLEQGVMASRLGAYYLERIGTPYPTLPPANPTPNCQFFPQTRHNLCEPFLSYWRTHGGLAQFGYPVNETYVGTADGFTGPMQYFERHRMEHHREFRGTRYEVLLGHLGKSLLQLNNALPPLPARTGPVPRWDFVGVNGDKFWLNGKPFTHVGANVTGLFYETRQQVIDDLDGLQRAGVKNVRAFLPNTAYTTQEIGDRLEYVLDEAGKRGIRVSPVLAHNYGQPAWYPEGRNGNMWLPGDEAYFVHLEDQYGKWTLYGHDWFAWAFRLHYKPFVEAIVWRFRNNPWIFSWGIGNELVDRVNHGGFIAYLAFYEEMAARIREIDPNHLITAGLLSTDHMPLAPQQQAQLYANPNIDFVTNVIYQGGNAWRDEPLARTFRKPYLLQEVGYQPLPDAPDPVVAMSNLFSEAYDVEGVDCVMQFGVEFGPPHGSADAIWGPSSQGRLNDYVALWQRWEAELKRRDGR